MKELMALYSFHLPAKFHHGVSDPDSNHPKIKTISQIKIIIHYIEN